jgi:hypothetical protein
MLKMEDKMPEDIKVERRAVMRNQEHAMTQLFEMVRDIQAQIRVQTVQIAEQGAAFIAHMDGEEKQYAQTNAELARMSDEISSVTVLVKAFPHVDGKPDVSGHRNDHETRMTDAEESKKFWKNMKQSIVTDGTKAIMIGLVVLLGIGAKEWIQQNLIPKPPVTITIPAK